MSAKKDFRLSALPALSVNQRKLTVRFSEHHDVPAVLEFYNANQHHNVDHRGDDVFADRTGNGRTLLILNPDRTIGMSSMSHPFDNVQSVEIGSTRSRLDGFGLYPFVIASQILHEFIERAPGNTFFACIHKENTAVSGMLHKKVGWNIVSPKQEFADAVGEGANIHSLSWLHADSNTLAHQARIVADTIARGYVENRKTQEILELDTSSFSLATTYLGHLQEIAHGRFGKIMEVSEPQPLEKVRHNLDRHMAGTLYLPEFHINP